MTEHLYPFDAINYKTCCVSQNIVYNSSQSFEYLNTNMMTLSQTNRKRKIRTMHNNNILHICSIKLKTQRPNGEIVSMAKCWKKGSNKYTEPTGLKPQQQRNNEKQKQKLNKATRIGCTLKKMHIRLMKSKKNNETNKKMSALNI